MKYPKLSVWLALAGLLTALSSVCVAQVTDLQQSLALSDEDFRKVVRRQFVNSSQLPDGIAFITTMELARASNSDNPNSTEIWIQSRMGLDPRESREFIALMMDALHQFEYHFRLRSRDIGCEFGVPKVVGDEVYSALELMDDARFELAEEQLVSFKKRLNEETAARFQQWLDQRKVGIVHVAFKHKELAKAVGSPSPDAQIAGICNMLGQSELEAEK